jgi:TPR repeat protein
VTECARALPGLVLWVLLLSSSCRQDAPRPVVATDGGAITVPNALQPCVDVAACEVRCDAGAAADCLGAGNAYATGQGTPRDERRANGLLVRSCDLGNEPACTFAGRMYEYAHGVAMDLPRAMSLYERACQKGYLGGCYNVALMLENGRGTAHDEVRASALYRQVCAGGSSAACEAATRLDVSPNGWPTHPREPRP